MILKWLLYFNQTKNDYYIQESTVWRNYIKAEPLKIVKILYKFIKIYMLLIFSNSNVLLCHFDVLLFSFTIFYAKTLSPQNHGHSLISMEAMILQSVKNIALASIRSAWSCECLTYLYAIKYFPFNYVIILLIVLVRNC